MVKNVEVETQLIRARTALYIDEPFYGVLALRLSMKENYKIKTLCVSHKHIYYNPDYVATLSPEHTMTAIAHEVEHILKDHLNRRNGRSPGKWNAAADYVVNDALVLDGFSLHKSWLHNIAYRGMTADHIYTLLPDQPDGPGDDPDDGGGDNDDYGAQDDMEPDQSDEERDTATTDWEIAAISAAKIAKEQGKLPASQERFVDELTNGKVNWRERLRRFAMAHAKNDYSWSRPQRRLIPYGHYLPSLHSEAMSMMVAAIDTSGSIDQYTLNLFGSEVIAAKNAARPQSLVNIYCDAAVNHVDTFGEFEEVKFKLHGGGGTDFRPPFLHLDKHGQKPDCLIYLTDGYGTFPADPPPYPVLWVMTTDVKAPWGETIRIES